jgi:hypothetical protein
VPLQYQYLSVWSGDKNVTHVTDKVNIDWDEISYILVPKRIVGERRSIERIDGKSVAYPVQYEHQFNCRSINQGIDPKLELSQKTPLDIKNC